MEVYVKAMRFVSILLDFSKIKCIQGACTHVILGFNEECTPEISKVWFLALTSYKIFMNSNSDT